MPTINFNIGKDEKKLYRLFNLLLVLLPASFPFYHSISSMLTIAILFVWILLGSYKNVFKAIKNKFVLLFILTYFISLISLFYSHNKTEGLFSLQKSLSLLLFPLIVYTVKISSKTLQWILYSFVISCSIVSFSCFIYAIYMNYSINSLTAILPDLYGTDMGNKLLGISHVYLSLYISFAIIIVCYFLITKEKHSYFLALGVTLIAFLLFFLFLLGGKMSIISLFLLSLIACLVFIIKTKRWVIGILFFLLPVSVFFITVSNSQKAKNRFYALFNPSNYEIGDNSWNSIGCRVSITKCTNEIFQRNPIIGTGIGDVQDDLDECTEGLKFSTLKGMNTHNQYFQYLLGTGIIGMLFFIIALIYPAVKAYYDENTLYLCFIFLFSLCCLTESLLERQQGIMFYAFFNSFFAFHWLNTQVPIEKESNLPHQV